MLLIVVDEGVSPAQHVQHPRKPARGFAGTASICRRPGSLSKV